MLIINRGLLKRDEILLGKCLSGIFILGRKIRSMFDQMCPEIRHGFLVLLDRKTCGQGLCGSYAA